MKNADSIDVEIEQKKRKSRLKANQHRVKEKVKSLTLPETLGRAAKLVSDKGASHWLTAVPLECHGRVLHKGTFRDALCPEYGWMPERLPTKCECGSAFSINHALNCPSGAFPILRHTEVRDFTGKLLAEVCPDVTLEPDLQPLEGESLDFASANHEDNARADIRARGFWGGNRQCTFFMSRFLTQTLNPTDDHPSSHALGVRKMPRNENMSNASLKWSMAHLRPWSSPPQAEWRAWHLHSTRDWLHSCRRRDERHIHPHWAGSAPTSVFPAPVCYHVHTGSSIKHQARCEGMRQLRPHYS